MPAVREGMTGHKDRPIGNSPSGFGDKAYAAEELVAELTAGWRVLLRVTGYIKEVGATSRKPSEERKMTATELNNVTTKTKRRAARPVTGNGWLRRPDETSQMGERAREFLQ